jgi:RHS repeat-associated protein
LPFGEEIQANDQDPSVPRKTPQGYIGLADNVRQKFTSKERDIETGLDYFGSRYYASMQGRFTSPDLIFISRRRLLDPQGINLYAYVRNNPLAYVDPNGEEFKGTDGKKVDIEEVDGQLIIRSKNATKDLIRLVNLINKSESSIALGQFNKLNASKTMINLVIDTTTVGGTKLGFHQPHGTRLDGSKGALKFNEDTNQFEGQADIVKDANGNEVYAEATITLFEGEYKKYLGGDTEAIEDNLVSTFGHEAQHDLDPNQIQATKTHTGTDAIYHARNPNGTPALGSPYWMTYKILGEIKDARALRAVRCIHGTCDKAP